MLLGDFVSLPAGRQVSGYLFSHQVTKYSYSSLMGRPRLQPPYQAITSNFLLYNVISNLFIPFGSDGVLSGLSPIFHSFPPGGSVISQKLLCDCDYPFDK